MDDRLRGRAEHRAARRRRRRRAGPVDRRRSRAPSRRPGRRRPPASASPATTVPAVGATAAGIRAAQPHVAVLGIDDRPGVAGGGDRRRRERPSASSGSRPRTTDVLDVVAQHRAVGARIAEEDAATRRRRWRRRCTAGRPRRRWGPGRAARDPPVQAAPRRSRRSPSDRRRSRPRWPTSVVPAGVRRRRAQRLVIEVGRQRLIDLRDLAVAVAEEIGRASAVCATSSGLLMLRTVSSSPTRRVHARVATPLAGLQRPHRGVDLGRLLRVEAGPHDARADHDGDRGDARRRGPRPCGGAVRATPVAKQGTDDGDAPRRAAADGARDDPGRARCRVRRGRRDLGVLVARERRDADVGPRSCGDLARRRGCAPRRAVAVSAKSTRTGCAATTRRSGTSSGVGDEPELGLDLAQRLGERERRGVPTRAGRGSSRARGRSAATPGRPCAG